jgi:hypothetical protein
LRGKARRGFVARAIAGHLKNENIFSDLRGSMFAAVKKLTRL